MKFIKPECVFPIGSDTDSFYFVLASQKLEDCVPDELKQEFFKARDKILVMHESQQRQLFLWKKEYFTDSDNAVWIGLTSKSYFIYDPKSNKSKKAAKVHIFCLVCKT